MRGVYFEEDRQSKNFRDAQQAGWTVSQIEILCSLNAFYQIVLGPLTAATRSELNVGLGRTTPITYGSRVRVDQAESDEIKECHVKFMQMIQKLGIDFWCLQASHSQDLLYRLANPR
jgi:hypothetical protein